MRAIPSLSVNVYEVSMREKEAGDGKVLAQQFVGVQHSASSRHPQISRHSRDFNPPEAQVRRWGPTNSHNAG